MNVLIFKNATIVNHDQTIYNGFIKIEQGVISKIGTSSIDEGIDLNGKYILPGFIDIHTHGTNGCDIMDGTKESLDLIVTSLPKEGTTSFLATTLTMSYDKLIAVVKNVNNFKPNPNGAKILGIHLEGPYVNCAYKGAQNDAYIQVPSITSLEQLLIASGDTIKTITYAPELAGTDFTDYVVSKNIVPSCGHSAATMEQVLQHVEHGLKNITHFHNGQTPHHHRTPGVVSAGLYSDQLYTELIVDGVHLHKDTVKLTHKIKTKDNIYLITDSMSAKNLKNGTYDLGGLEVIKTDDEVRTKDGNLAGSILHLDRAIKNMMEYTKCSINEIVSMSSYNQAKMLQMEDRIGYLGIGYPGDFIVLDHNFNLEETYINGKRVYKK